MMLGDGNLPTPSKTATQVGCTRRTGRLWLGALLLAGVVVNGHALDGAKETAMTQISRDKQGNAAAQDVTPAGYPYSPGDLWRRLMEVIKTPPDELTYRKFGEIFGLEFDPDKTIWYGDREAGKDFLLSKRAIRNIEAFPFKQISLSHGRPSPADETRRRHMSFDFDLFDYTLPQSTQRTQSEGYCLRPRFADIEALGYFYDELGSNMDPRTGSDARGEPIRVWFPYKEKIFVDDLNNRLRSPKTVILKMQPDNGCLISLSYFNSSKY